MATSFESVYEKFLMQIDDYELGIVEDYELNNICFSYLEKARALYFHQCTKDLNDITVNEVKFVNGIRVEDVEVPSGENDAEVLSETAGELSEVENEPVEEELVEVQNDELGVLEGFLENADENEIIETQNRVFIMFEGFFNQDLTNSEQYILALGMKKAWLSSKKFSADLMSKDIGDRDYKAVQGFNYLKELRLLDAELEEEIRKNGVQYTYSLQDLTSGW